MGRILRSGPNATLCSLTSCGRVLRARLSSMAVWEILIPCRRRARKRGGCGDALHGARLQVPERRPRRAHGAFPLLAGYPGPECARRVVPARTVVLAIHQRQPALSGHLRRASVRRLSPPAFGTDGESEQQKKEQCYELSLHGQS